MQAQIKIPCKDPESIVGSIKPDEKESARFKADVKAGKNEIVLKIEANDLGAMQAALNSYLRLIRTVEGLGGIK